MQAYGIYSNFFVQPVSQLIRFDNSVGWLLVTALYVSTYIHIYLYILPVWSTHTKSAQPAYTYYLRLEMQCTKHIPRLFLSDAHGMMYLVFANALTSCRRQPNRPKSVLPIAISLLSISFLP